jgi:hypothetical protein
MKHLFYTILFACFTVVSLAQGSFKPGYVVAAKGDTLNGYLHYISTVQNPKQVSFKKDLNAEAVIYKAGDILAFGDKKTSFVHFYGRISRDPINIATPLNYRDTTYTVEHVFLQVLEKGKHLILYSFSDDVKDRYYIAEAPDFAPSELVYRLYWDAEVAKNKDGRGGQTVNENTYMAQLFTLADKYNALDNTIQRTIEEADYRKYNIRQVVKKINQK